MYGSKITFECDDGHRAYVSKRGKKKKIKSQTFTCSDDGTWSGANAVEDCQCMYLFIVFSTSSNALT